MTRNPEVNCCKRAFTLLKNLPGSPIFAPRVRHQETVGQ
jgi:hypothetical protein